VISHWILALLSQVSLADSQAGFARWIRSLNSLAEFVRWIWSLDLVAGFGRWIWSLDLVAGFARCSRWTRPVSSQWILAPLSQVSLSDSLAGFTHWIRSLDSLATHDGPTS
jgi:hypothetical protein